jgi:hypothetical protein
MPSPADYSALNAGLKQVLQSTVNWPSLSMDWRVTAVPVRVTDLLPKADSDPEIDTTKANLFHTFTAITSIAANYSQQCLETLKTASPHIDFSALEEFLKGKYPDRDKLDTELDALLPGLAKADRTDAVSTRLEIEAKMAELNRKKNSLPSRSAAIKHIVDELSPAVGENGAKYIQFFAACEQIIDTSLERLQLLKRFGEGVHRLAALSEFGSIAVIINNEIIRVREKLEKVSEIADAMESLAFTETNDSNLYAAALKQTYEIAGATLRSLQINMEKLLAPYSELRRENRTGDRGRS